MRARDAFESRENTHTHPKPPPPPPLSSTLILSFHTKFSPNQSKKSLPVGFFPKATPPWCPRREERRGQMRGGRRSKEMEG